MRERITVITIPCEEGNVEAIRLPNNVWDINFPWGAEKYYGSASEVRTRINQRIRAHNAADESELS